MKPVIAIFDIGRTNKKFLLLDRGYQVLEEVTDQIPDIQDEDGDACEDIQKISVWMMRQIKRVMKDEKYEIQGINFSAHGAAFVHLDEKGQPVTPLYAYMKPLAKEVADSFYNLFGGRKAFSVATGAPALDMLNVGVQLYLLKTRNSHYFKDIKTSLHLPQYANYLFSGKKHADISSIGCHTGLWDFKHQRYHEWLEKEKLDKLLPAPESVNTYDKVKIEGKEISVGIGMHDSSAALYPYVKTADKPFVFLSTGTWNITLNPFFKGQLENERYQRDCLYFLLEKDRKVAASRLFLGNEYDYQVKRLQSYFNREEAFGGGMFLNKDLIAFNLKKISPSRTFYPETMLGTGPFPNLKKQTVDLSQFDCFEEAYYQMVLDLAYLQKVSIELVCEDMKQLYVSGGFIRNKVFMELLQGFFPDWDIYITENKRASVLGAAIAIHDAWQETPLPDSVSPVRRYRKKLNLDLRQYREGEQDAVEIHSREAVSSKQ